MKTKPSQNKRELKNILFLFKFYAFSVKNINLLILLKFFKFLPKVSFFWQKDASFYFIYFGKRLYKADKKDKKYLEKTLKTWKNHGKIMEFCWSAVVGTLITNLAVSTCVNGMARFQ